MGLVTTTVAELILVKEPPLTKAVKVTTLPFPIVLPGGRVAVTVTRLRPGTTVWTRVPLIRLLVNIGVLEPAGVTVRVPLAKVHNEAEEEHALEVTGLRRAEVSSLMVFIVPTTSRKKGLAKLDLIVPLRKSPVVYSILLANAAVGKTRAKSANSITRFILILLHDCYDGFLLPSA